MYAYYIFISAITRDLSMFIATIMRNLNSARTGVKSRKVSQKLFTQMPREPISNHTALGKSGHIKSNDLLNS